MSLFDLSPEEFTALSVLIGFALLPGLTTQIKLLEARLAALEGQSGGS